TYALDGSIKRISGNATFIVTPTSVALCDADTDAAEEALQASPVPGTAPRTAAATDPVAAMFSGADEDPET
ncbi:MAG: cell division protein SepF, partial [Clostridia bacterium]|nr:cell division protein SepF [Clostridia bacterium]